MSRLPETGPSLRRIIEQQKRRATRNENASPYTRSGMSVTAEGRVEVTGQMQSWDYDGTSRAALGTTGWMLGPDDGGASLLALNGIDVYASLAARDVTILGLIDALAAQQATLDAQQATLATTVTGLSTAQATLADQVADLASRVTVTTSIATFNTGSLPNDALFHAYGAGIPITISVPTGKLVVTVGCGQASITPGTSGAVTAEATFSLSNGSLVYGDISARGFAAYSNSASGASLTVQRALTLAPGTYTVTGQMRAWSSGSAAGSVQFQQPYLTVQVTG